MVDSTLYSSISDKINARDTDQRHIQELKWSTLQQYRSLDTPPMLVAEGNLFPRRDFAPLTYMHAILKKEP